MIWLLIIVGAYCFIRLIKFLIKFLRAVNQQEKRVAAYGGIKQLYKELIDGLMEYESARISQEKNTRISIAGVFYDPICNHECGVWAFYIQITFALLHVQYWAHIELSPEETINESWDFPVDMPQSEILNVLKAKADESNIYGIIK